MTSACLTKVSVGCKVKADRGMKCRFLVDPHSIYNSPLLYGSEASLLQARYYASHRLLIIAIDYLLQL